MGRGVPFTSSRRKGSLCCMRVVLGPTTNKSKGWGMSVLPGRHACLEAQLYLQAGMCSPNRLPVPQNRDHVQWLIRQKELCCLQASPAQRWLQGSSCACPPHAHARRHELVCRTSSLWFTSPLRRLLPGRDIQSGAGDGSHSSSKTQFLSVWWNKWYLLSKEGYKNMCLKRMSGTWVLIFKSKTTQNK